MKQFWCTLSVAILFSSQAFTATAGYKLFVQNVNPYLKKAAEPGKSEGLIAEILENAILLANLHVDGITADKPWPELQEIGKTTENSLIAPYGRTPQREANYRWIAPILEDKLYAFTKTSKAVPNSFDDLAKEKAIGVTQGSTAESRAKELKLKFSPVTSPKDLFKGLLEGKFDVILSQHFVSGLELKALGAEAETIHRGSALLTLPLWVATSLKTSDGAFLDARKAIEKYKASPDYEKILTKYSATTFNNKRSP